MVSGASDLQIYSLLPKVLSGKPGSRPGSFELLEG